MSAEGGYLERLQNELEAAIQKLPSALQSDNAEAMLDYLATVFDETDGQPITRPSVGPSEASGGTWPLYLSCLHDGQSNPEAAQEIARMCGQSEQVRAEIREMDAANIQPGLEAASRVASCSGQMQLVQCDSCSRVLLAEAVQGHLAQCVKRNIDSRMPTKLEDDAAELAAGEHDVVEHWDPVSGRYIKRKKTSQGSRPRASQGLPAPGTSLNGQPDGLLAPPVPRKEIRGGLMRASKCGTAAQGNPFLDGGPPMLRPREGKLNLLQAKLPHVPLASSPA